MDSNDYYGDRARRENAPWLRDDELAWSLEDDLQWHVAIPGRQGRSGVRSPCGKLLGGPLVKSAALLPVDHDDMCETCLVEATAYRLGQLSSSGVPTSEPDEDEDEDEYDDDLYGVTLRVAPHQDEDEEPYL